MEVIYGKSLCFVALRRLGTLEGRTGLSQAEAPGSLLYLFSGVPGPAR
jgi:hypothetical protein